MLYFFLCNCVHNVPISFSVTAKDPLADRLNFLLGILGVARVFPCPQHATEKRFRKRQTMLVGLQSPRPGQTPPQEAWPSGSSGDLNPVSTKIQDETLRSSGQRPRRRGRTRKPRPTISRVSARGRASLGRGNRRVPGRGTRPRGACDPSGISFLTSPSSAGTSAEGVKNDRAASSSVVVENRS